jgi:type I restriction enzyme S subunit
MSEWKEYNLGEVAEINKRSIGKNYPFQNIEYIDTASVTENKFEETPIIQLSEAPSRAKRLVKIGDTILSTVRPIQKHYAYIKSVKPNTVISTGFAVVTPLKIDSKFLYYFLTQEEITRYLNTIAEGGTTTFPAFRADELKDLIIYAPKDINEQTAIAEILSSLDDKIELNNQINKDLEALAQALFKQWFIDFEFPNESGEPYRSSGGEMIDSELGEIPKGWKVFYLNEIANCFDNKRIPLSSMERAKRKGSYPYYGAASLMDYVDDFIFDGVYLLIGEDGSVTDNLGYPVIQYVFGKFWTNNHAHVLQGTNISTELLMCLMKNTNIEHLVTGAVQPKLNQGNMNKICIALPNDISIIKSIEESINVFFEQVRENISENNQLISLREFLLPKLISGELEVSDIQSNTL